MMIWDVIKEIVTTKAGDCWNDPQFRKAFDKFMLVRWLSMNEDFAEAATIANHYQTTLDAEQFYKLLLKIVPQKNYYRINYIKKST